MQIVSLTESDAGPLSSDIPLILNDKDYGSEPKMLPGSFKFACTALTSVCASRVRHDNVVCDTHVLHKNK